MGRRDKRRKRQRRQDHHVKQYVEGVEHNNVVIGVDLGTGPSHTVLVARRLDADGRDTELTIVADIID